MSDSLESYTPVAWRQADNTRSMLYIYNRAAVVLCMQAKPLQHAVSSAQSLKTQLTVLPFCVHYCDVATSVIKISLGLVHHICLHPFEGNCTRDRTTVVMKCMGILSLPAKLSQRRTTEAKAKQSRMRHPPTPVSAITTAL